MNTLQSWTTFFGWLTVANLGLYLITIVALFAMKSFAYGMTAKMFGVSEDVVAKATLDYIGRFKLLIAVFCLGPWLALKLMA